MIFRSLPKKSRKNLTHDVLDTFAAYFDLLITDTFGNRMAALPAVFSRVLSNRT